MAEVSQRREAMMRSLSPQIENLLSNSFTRGLVEKSLPADVVLRAFQEYRFYCASFPRFLGMLLSRSNDEIVRQPLIINLWEESGEGDLQKTHLKMLDRFLANWSEAIGLEKWNVLNPTGVIAPKFCADIQTFLLEKSLPEVFGFIGPGTEEVTARQYDLFVKGLVSYGLVTEADLDFFTAHLVADVRHADLFWDALAAVCTNETSWELAQRGAAASLTLETEFWRNLLEEVSST